MSRPTAKQFLDAFVCSFAENFELCKKDAGSWERIWKWSWDPFMLWKTGQPDLIDASVLAKTADRLGLGYYEGQPFNLDGAFYDRDYPPKWKFPFPLVVAFEHENHQRGFDDEICKLLSVRCPLKVGITYADLRTEENRPEERRRVLQDLCKIIKERFAQISGLVGKEPASEYLFLVGTEEAPYSLQWHALSFSASQGPNGPSFIPVGPLF